MAARKAPSPSLGAALRGERRQRPALRARSVVVDRRRVEPAAPERADHPAGNRARHRMRGGEDGLPDAVGERNGDPEIASTPADALQSGEAALQIATTDGMISM